LAAEAKVRQAFLTSRDGTRLRVRVWMVDRPVVWIVVAHGLGEHSGRYDRLATALGHRDIGCCAVDLRGMGESPGRRGRLKRWQQWVDDFATLYDNVVEESGGEEVVPLGHSFGGVVVTTAVLHGDIKPQRFVLSNPAFRAAVEVPMWKLRLARVASRVAPALALSNGVDPSLLSRDPAVVEDYRSDRLVHGRLSTRLAMEWMAASQEALDRAGELTVPFLLIVGSEDRVIDPQGAAEFSARATVDHVLKLYQGRYHEPFNDLDSEQVFEDLAAWLLRRS
jgi:alpha-beta hydrolase superfamily lysophospholipase